MLNSPSSVNLGNRRRPLSSEVAGMAALRVAGLLAVLAGALFGAGPSRAEKIPAPVCRLALLEIEFDLEDLGLDLDLARSKLTAREQIFKLVDSLWKDEATQRMVYLAAKHDRDVARLGVEKGRLRIARQEALVEQYRLVCDAIASGRTLEDRQDAIDAAHERHRQAQCDLVAIRAETAVVDLEYYREVLASVMDLREHDVATRQDVIIAEMNVEKAEKRLKQARQRAERCPKSD